MKTSVFFLFVSLLFLSINTFSQSVDFSLENFYERRSSMPFNSNLMLKLNVTGFDEPEPGRKIKVSEAYAVDERGDTLQMLNSRWELFSVFSDCSFNLEIPSRKTRKLVLVRGKVKVTTPSEAKGSIVRLKNFLLKSGRNLLAGYDEQLKMVVLDSVDYPAFFREYRPIYRQSLLEQEPDLSEAELREAMQTVDQMEADATALIGRKEVLFLATNDEERDILELEIYDQNGNEQLAGGALQYCRMNDRLAALLGLQAHNFKHLRLNTFVLDAPPRDGWEMEVTFAKASSTREYTFTLHDIILP